MKFDPLALSKKTKIALAVFVLLGLSFVLFHVGCAAIRVPDIPYTLQEPVVPRQATTIALYPRVESTSMLTLPEWYTVYSYQEYAQFVQTEKPSTFPYLGAIGQYWSGYCTVAKSTRNYPANAPTHIMLSVVGSSFSLEYALQGLYENTIGRITEWDSYATQEDQYAAAVAQEYGAFIPYAPWYDYPFGNRAIGVWTETDLFGPHFLRKFERKYYLSFNYGVKAVYASLIRLGTHATYGAPDDTTYFTASNVSDLPETVRTVAQLDADTYILAAPHYQGFTDMLPELVASGVIIEDVGGNDEIFLTVLAPAAYEYQHAGTVLITMPILTDGRQRIGVVVPTNELSSVVSAVLAEQLVLEHVHDY